MANRYGTLKKQNEQISVGYFCGKHAMYGNKKNGNIPFLFVGLCFFLGPLRK